MRKVDTADMMLEIRRKKGEHGAPSFATFQQWLREVEAVETDTPSVNPSFRTRLTAWLSSPILRS